MAQTNSVGGKKLVPVAWMKTLPIIFILLGVASFGLGLMTNKERIWPAFLVSFFFFTSIALGGLFFTAIQHATSAGWSVAIRRFIESIASFLPYAGALALVYLVGAKHLYIWLDPVTVAGDRLLKIKSAYLNMGFFSFRVIAFFGLWWLFAKMIIGNSLLQDETGESDLTARNAKISVIFLMVFALSYSLFSVDTIMSLQPHWYSTIFGVYCFAGLFQGVIAMTILITLWMMKNNYVTGLVSDHHLHDLGKFLKAFTVFYAYIGFSQFMLIWYANLPEETEFFLHRSHGAWMTISLSLLFLKFIVPFLALLPRWAKRTPKHLASVAILILVMEYVDIYWMVYPNFNDNHAVFGWQEIGPFIGMLGLFMFAVVRFLSRNNIVPVRDPRLSESIHHVVTY